MPSRKTASECQIQSFTSKPMFCQWSFNSNIRKQLAATGCECCNWTTGAGGVNDAKECLTRFWGGVSTSACCGLLSPPLAGRGGEGGTTNAGACGLPPFLTLPHKGGGNQDAIWARASSYAL